LKGNSGAKGLMNNFNANFNVNFNVLLSKYVYSASVGENKKDFDTWRS